MLLLSGIGQSAAGQDAVKLLVAETAEIARKQADLLLR